MTEDEMAGWYHRLNEHGFELMGVGDRQGSLVCLCPWDFSGKNTRVGCHFFLQGIFLTQRSKLSLLCWQADSLLLNYQGSPVIDNTD